MRRYRRMVLMDRLIPFLAAGVGLIALAGAVVVQISSETRSRLMLDELGQLRAAIDNLDQRADELATAADNGTAAGLLALQDRMNKLEADLKAQKDTVASTPVPPASIPEPGGGGEQAAAAEVDPNLPTTDCIPLGIRFMVKPGETYPICQSTVKLEVGAITDSSVDITGVGPVVETGFGTIIGTKCAVMVFSADAAGFAEVRVTCV